MADSGASPKVVQSQDDASVPSHPGSSVGFVRGAQRSRFSPLKILQQLSIAQRIGGCCAIALGVTITGTLLGFSLANQYQAQALDQVHHSKKEVQMLHQLQMSLLRIGASQQEIAVKKNLKEQIQQLEANFNGIEQSWQNLKHFSHDANHTTEEHEIGIPHFITTHDPFIQQSLKNLRQELHSLQQKSYHQTAKTALDPSRKVEFYGNFLLISQQLDALILTAYSESENTSFLLEKAEQQRIQIITSSIVISIMISLLLVFLTSRAIAHPLNTASRIAQQSIQNHNFDLQIPIATSGEIASLIGSINYLIAGVRQLLNERKAAEAHLIQREKMSSLGQMVAGVAHEINNPVSFIHGNLSHVHEYLEDLLQIITAYQQQYPAPAPSIQALLDETDLPFLKEDSQRMVQSMYRGTDRIRQIVLSLRTFSHLDESDMKEVDIHKGIDSTLIILKYRLQSTLQRPISIEKDYAKLPLIQCYPSQFNQVILNLLNNAIDAIEEKHKIVSADLPKLTIRTRQSTDGIEIYIADNGVGMSEMVLPRIFDPFFTTKAIGQGTGLGLSVSYQIITKRHGGKLSCQSRLGQGSEFRIEIPHKAALPTSILPLMPISA
jgi:two-component system, NtrC family, sensor kinase